MSPPPPLEHDYIGLSDVSKRSSDSKASDSDSLKETELRLGLPGSESSSVGLSLGLHLQPKSGAKRGFFDANNGNKIDVEKNEKKGDNNNNSNNMVKDENKKNQQQINSSAAPAAKAQVVGWPPIRSYRKNTMATNPSKNKENGEGKQGLGFLYVKVSMDGAPYLRKVDLKTYTNYKELSSALGKMFICFTIGQCGSHDVPGRDGLSENGLMDLLTGSEYVLTYEDKDADWMLVGDVPWEMFTDSCKRLRIMKGSDAIGLGARVALEEEVYQDQQLYEDQVADQYVEQVNDDQQC